MVAIKWIMESIVNVFVYMDLVHSYRERVFPIRYAFQVLGLEMDNAGQVVFCLSVYLSIVKLQWL